MKLSARIVAALGLTLTAVLSSAEDVVRPTDEPIPVTATELLDGKYDFRFVRIEGTIVDFLHDKVDPRFRLFVVNSGDETVLVTSRTLKEDDETLRSLVGATVSVCGKSDRDWTNRNNRQFSRTLYLYRLDDVKVLKPGPASPFDVEELSGLKDVRPARIPRLGRRRTTGKVLARWGRNKLLVLTRNDDVTRIELDAPTTPNPGDFIEAAGVPESDVFHLNLVRAIWRPAKPFAHPADDSATNLSARAILTDDAGRPAFDEKLHGRLIRLSGLLRSQPPSGVLYLEDGDFLVPVDASALAELPDRLSVGCRIAVTGICVMNAEAWRPTAVFPRIDGFTLVPRAAEDIVILSRPPWWTAGRLLAVIGTLLAVIVGIVIWNGSLQRLARKRGHELYRSQIEKFASDLRTGERNRLAVELHDTISQNLTGISMQIGAAANFVNANQERASKHLDIATRALDSCRDELRNCIWDLRNGALDKHDMNAAIRNALSPYVGDTHLAVRFSVPRSDLSEKTAHTIICIVRELAANAVRHGQAQSVRVAGATEGRTLSISVTDDGQGFDPDSRPGVSEGHYGLQGIRERLKDYAGALSLESAPGRGTKAVVTLTLPHEERKI